MTPKTIAKIRNLETDDLRRVIDRVRGEAWRDEEARQSFLQALEDESAGRDRKLPRR